MILDESAADTRDPAWAGTPKGKHENCQLHACVTKLPAGGSAMVASASGSLTTMVHRFRSFTSILQFFPSSSSAAPRPMLGKEGVECKFE